MKSTDGNTDTIWPNVGLPKHRRSARRTKMHPDLSPLLPVTDIDFGWAFGANIFLLVESTNAEHRTGSPQTLATMADAYNIRIGGHFGGLTLTASSRSPPCLLRLPHCEQTSRRRHSGTGVSGLHQRACSAGSGSLRRPHALHQTTSRRWAAAALSRWASVGLHLTAEVVLKESSRQSNCLLDAIQVVFIPLRVGCFCSHVCCGSRLLALLAGNHRLPR